MVNYVKLQLRCNKQLYQGDSKSKTTGNKVLERTSRYGKELNGREELKSWKLQH